MCCFPLDLTRYWGSDLGSSRVPSCFESTRKPRFRLGFKSWTEASQWTISFRCFKSSLGSILDFPFQFSSPGSNLDPGLGQHNRKGFKFRLHSWGLGLGPHNSRTDLISSRWNPVPICVSKLSFSVQVLKLRPWTRSTQWPNWFNGVKIKSGFRVGFKRTF